MRFKMTSNVKIVSVGRGKVELQVTLDGVSVEGAPAGITHLHAGCDTGGPITFYAGDALSLPVEWDVDL
jgi:hypothetical protein